MLCAEIATPEAPVAPEVAPAKGTTSSAWGAPKASTPRAALAAGAAVLVALVAGVIALRWPGTAPPLPVPAAASAPTASIATPPATLPSVRLPEPAPSVTASVALAPPHPGGARIRVVRPAPSATTVALSSASEQPPPAPSPPAPPPPKVDVRDPALDGR